MTKRRVAILGMFLESNRFSRTTGAEQFRQQVHLTGDEITADARCDFPKLMKEYVGFYAGMDARGDWEPVPILVTGCGAGGAADHGFFLEVLAEIEARLAKAGPLDGVYIGNHGAMITTEEQDADGVFYAEIRRMVGPDVPIVVTLDPHGNVSEQMIDKVDIVASYITDPHIDHADRGAEVAGLLHELWDGMKPQVVSVRLPIVPPNVATFTGSGAFGEMVDMGQARLTPDIANVSILGGFAFSDTWKNGLTIIVTGRNTEEAARALARDLADYGWANRERFICEAEDIDYAVARIVATGRDPALPPSIYSDLGDNCGAGGPACTTWMLEAVHAAGAQGVLIMNFCDPELAAEAHERGLGAKFTATFHGDDWGVDGQKNHIAEAEVLALYDDPVVGRHGIVKGKTIYPGPMALLDLGGVQVVVISRRVVGNDPIYAEVLGVDLSTVRSIVVKVRSSFPVGFDEFIAEENIHFVDTPGRTSPMLSRMPLEHIPRPVYPLDSGFDWTNPL
jgi:microcystin degradation protein MlrC